MKKNLSTILLIIIFFIGLAVLLYPSVSDIYNNALHQNAITAYENQVSVYTPEDYQEFWELVDGYNKELASHSGTMDFVNGYPQDGYYQQMLSFTGNSIMAYIEIPSIDVRLPIYHGTSDPVLASGIGHLEGSSLPGGGKGTHTVLSGHRGLPSATLFTNLDKLEAGDVFYIHVLNRTLTYMVDDVSIVLPYEIENLTIDPNKDYVTLVTCTPYGVNSHRLLVRGTRLDSDNGFDAAAEYTFRVYKDAEIYGVNVIAPIAMVPLLILVLIYILVHYRNRKSS